MRLQELRKNRPIHWLALFTLLPCLPDNLNNQGTQMPQSCCPLCRRILGKHKGIAAIRRAVYFGSGKSMLDQSLGRNGDSIFALDFVGSRLPKLEGFQERSEME
ncbi:hypothetical protein FB45DRAFT_904617 [Roridomyces roridus]|uniref:Uncharacterized protein n=1 Tax=Roridomyces roridus TaxID=1738132 RepID=A0AAD7FV89_9AGAR|nr:hypothetical protein FB45DRAFT_904617 [Roridomyces roridus]